MMCAIPQTMAAAGKGASECKDTRVYEHKETLVGHDGPHGDESRPKSAGTSPQQGAARVTTESSTTKAIGEEQLSSASATSDGRFGKMPPTSRAVRGGPVTWASLVLLAITGAGLLYYFDREKKRRLESMRQGTAEVMSGPAIGKAAIGGPFKLVNQDGQSITDEDLKGNWSLIYFGFTHCPDICPDELQKMAEAIDIVDRKLDKKVVPVFISVDPERDGVEQIREYVKEFHPRLIGLTGSVDDVRQVARAYRVYYMKTDVTDSDYLVDHSIIMYLMDPNMEFVKFFGKNHDVNQLADGIATEIRIKDA